jgi:hypothetical protein
MKISDILMPAALFNVDPSFIASSAEQPSGRSITLGDLTFSNHGTNDVRTKASWILEADNYYFAPTFLRGTPGQKLTVEVENELSSLHNFSIPDQRLEVNIPPKGTVLVAIVFSIVWGGALFLQVSLGARHEWRAADRRHQASGRLLPEPQIK